jgi:hypothetical protein
VCTIRAGATFRCADRRHQPSLTAGRIAARVIEQFAAQLPLTMRSLSTARGAVAGFEDLD